MLEHIGFDLRFAARTLIKAPVFSVTAILTLVLGMVPTTAVFTVVNAIILRPLGYPYPERIVLYMTNTPNGTVYGASMTKFNTWKEQTQVFEDVAAYEYRPTTFVVREDATAEQVTGIRVSADYFRLLGAPVVLGRTFTAEEDRPDGGRSAVISYALWKRYFGGSREAIGRSIVLNRIPYTVLGVVGSSFNTQLDAPPDLWLPFQIDPASNDQSTFFNVLARLKPAVTLAEANANLQSASEEFRRKYPNIMGPHDKFAVASYGESLVGDIRPSLLLLSAAVSFVLLIACANTANLLLVRAAGRTREISLRMALGAGRGQIIRQLLTESILLAFLSGALALPLGYGALRALAAVNSANLPRIGEHGAAITMDWRLAAFTITASLGTGILFGLAPAIGLVRSDFASRLREGGSRSGVGFRQKKGQGLLIMTEIALATILLIGASLLIRTFVALRTVETGFDTHNIVTARMAMTGSQEKTFPEALVRMEQTAIPRLEAIPGVLRATVAYDLPLNGMFGIPFNIPGRTPANGRYDGRGWEAVSPGYFEVFGIRLIAGRGFRDNDDQAAQAVAIINQSLASHFWPRDNPIGKTIWLGKNYGADFEEPPRQIVGVVADIRDSGPAFPPTPGVYVPFAQVKDGVVKRLAQVTSLAWAIRVRGESFSLQRAIKQELLTNSDGQPVTKILSMNELVYESTARNRFNMLLMGVFAVSAVILAAIGIYGLMAYTTEHRTHEIGVMFALGAEPLRIVRTLAAQAMKFASLGIAIGVLAGLALVRSIASLLFGVTSRDPLVFIGVPLVVAGVSLISALGPAIRAGRIDAAEALRRE
jgi:predicted permease